MPVPPPETITQLIEAVRDGDANALNKLFPLVYDELHAQAQYHRRHWHGDYTVNTTALVHEAYLKLADQTQANWTSRAHFFAVAAKAMRHILINYAERRRAQKRGGDVPKVSLDEVNVMFEKGVALTDERSDDLLSLNEALRMLEQVNPRQCRIVECRFFGGMTIEETATALDVSPATVKRGWALARVWLFRAIQESLDA